MIFGPNLFDLDKLFDSLALDSYLTILRRLKTKELNTWFLTEFFPKTANKITEAL